MALNFERRSRYLQLEQQIGNTPFVEVTGITLPRRCRLFAKEEYKNPTGSHYDREMVRFLRELEDDGHIEPGKTRMLETTTGNSGASFAWLCRALGYPPPKIIIPADMPYARRAQIESYGAELILSEAGQYITGISRSYARFYTRLADKTDPSTPWCPHHWEDEVCGVQAMKECGDEIIRDAREQGVNLEYFVLALGNGSSARGVGSVLAQRDITLLGLEPSESPIIAEYLGLPGFESRAVRDRHHGIIGTGPFQQSEIYPNAKVASSLLTDILHVNTEESHSAQIQLVDAGFHVGMSSAACFAAVEKYIDKFHISNKVFGVIFYDPSWKYL